MFKITFTIYGFSLKNNFYAHHIVLVDFKYGYISVFLKLR